MPRRLAVPLLLAAILFGYLAGYAANSSQPASAQQASSAQAPAWSTIPLAPNQGEPMYWSSETLKKTHATLASRSKGRILSKPRDLMDLPITRTHSFDVVHRPRLDKPPTAEQHEGVTDLYFIMGGSGTLFVGGEIENRQAIQNRPGEFTGLLKNGKPYKVKEGDIVAIPPNLPHASQGDEGGLTYMLTKINIGIYPWSLVSGTN